jgi:hypothetical protein
MLRPHVKSHVVARRLNLRDQPQISLTPVTISVVARIGRSTRSGMKPLSQLPATMPGIEPTRSVAISHQSTVGCSISTSIDVTVCLDAVAYLVLAVAKAALLARARRPQSGQRYRQQVTPADARKANCRIDNHAVEKASFNRKAWIARRMPSDG